MLLCLYFSFFHQMNFLNLSFLCLFLAVLGLHCCTWLSLAVVSGVYSLVAVCGLLPGVVPLVAEHGL